MKEDNRQISGEKTFIIVLFLFSLFVLFEAIAISGFSAKSSPGAFPMFSSAIMVISLFFVFLKSRRQKRVEAKNFWDEIKQAGQKVFPRILLVFTGSIILYMIIIEPWGFIISSYLFLLFSMVYLKGANILKSVIISGVTLAAIYVIFHYFFTVVLP